MKDDLQELLQKLRPFQKKAFDVATTGSNKGRMLIADEMGLGKTVTSLAIMLSFKEEWPLLILCPASLRYTWPSEIEKFYPHLPSSAVYVVKGFDDCDFYSNPVKRDRIKIVIAAYSLLQNRSASARVLEQFKFKCVIADESHNLKEKNSQRCKLAMPLIMSAKRVLLLSGTPSLARPVELWPQLYCINQNLFGSYTNYTKKYCNARKSRFGWDVKGISNADELNKRLKAVMIRRLKRDVLTELPAKQRCLVPVTIQKSEHIKNCKQIISQLNETRQSLSSLVGEEANDANFEARSLLMQAYQASGIGKAQSVAEYVLDWLKGSEQKLLVFAHHQEVLDTIEAAVSKHLKGVGHIRIDGSVPSIERAARVKKFQNKSQVRLGLLSITAAGVGLTLTAASSVIFAELHWTPGVLAQAEDRCHRIGQAQAVNIMFCVCKDKEISVDMQLWNMLGRKVNNVGRMIDGEKKSGMNAEMSENNASSEEELASFFSNCPNETSKGSTQSISKGSIQSFFLKSSKPSSTEKNTIKGQKVDIKPKESEIVILDDCDENHCQQGGKSIKSSFFINSTKKRNHFTMTTGAHQVSNKDEKGKSKDCLECKSCTFLNVSSATKCKMCHAAFPESKMCEGMNIGWEEKILPESKVSCLEHKHIKIDEEDNEVECQTCTFLNTPTASKCTMCNSKLQEKILPTRTMPTKVSRTDTTHSLGLPIPDIPSQTSEDSEVIELLDDSDQEDNNDTGKEARKIMAIQEKEANTSILSFSVSQNSGRFSMYKTCNRQNLFFNFDVEQIISEETSDEILKQQICRNGNSKRIGILNVNFNSEALGKSKCDNLIQYLRRIFFSNSISVASDIVRRACFDVCSLETVIKELQSFTSSYLALREIEKKKIQGFESPIEASGLRQTLRMIALSECPREGTTERYVGGRKEQAIENEKNGIASAEDIAILNGEACAWCGESLQSVAFRRGVQSTYCSQECAEEGRLKRGGMYSSTRLRAQLFSLEQGICQLCGLDANGRFYFYQ